MSSPVPAPPYAGNPSLPAEVREKILSTFRHALNLFTSGNVSDCMIGCEFILKMDPRFTPARQLQEKVRNRDSSVDISDLQAAAVSAPTPGPSPARPEPAPAPAPPPPAPAPAPAPQVEPDLRQSLIESTRARVEQALDEGRVTEARLELERLRALDPEHATIAALERRLSGASAAAAGPGPMPDFSLDPGGPDPFAGGLPEGDIFRESSEPAGLDPFTSAAPRPASPPPRRQPPPAPPVPAAQAGDPQPASSDLFLPAQEPEVPGMPSMKAPPSAFEEEEARTSEREIATLLRQGDETARKGERQQAIEVWSRVFLIDINNAEAVTRIEKARQEMTDKSRLIAEYLKKGRESFEGGDREEARKLFLQAQELDPNEATARLYLERIEQAKGEPAASSAPAAPRAGGKPAAAARTDDDFSVAPPLAPAATRARARGLAIPKVNPRVLALIGAFLALTLAGIFFVFKGPKSRAGQTAGVATAGSLQNARDLLAKGKITEARAELRRIGPGDADAEEARRLLADLGKPAGRDTAAGKSAASVQPPAGAAHGDNDPARLRAAAEKALAEKRYIEALKNFNLAAPAFRDDPAFTQMLGLASDKVTLLTPAVKFYNEGEYETAIPILWRLVQEDRENRDARSYLLRSYYNQGISQLKNGLYPKAAQAFHEALAIDPNDAEALRHQKFAERYLKGDLDLLGRIYVRHLNHRP